MLLRLKTKAPLASAASLMAFFVFAFVRARSAESYTLIDLGTLPGFEESRPTAINNLGQVVGWADGEDENCRAFLWENGTITNLNGLFGLRTIACDINNSGVIVGVAARDGQRRAFVWSGGQAIDLGAIDEFPKLGGRENFNPGLSVNDLNQVTGRLTCADGNQRSFIWTEGQIAYFGLQPDGTVLHASAINARGQTVGQAFKHGRSRAFLWERGLPPNLATLGGPRAAAMAINDHGIAVGWSIPGEGGLETAHAYVWEKGRMIDIGTLGGNHSRAYSVNSSGQVVGFSSRSDKRSAAFLWEKGRMMDLNDLLKTNVYHLTVAYDINDRGQIVAVGIRAGRRRACLVNPSRIRVATPALVSRQAGNAPALVSEWTASPGVQLARFQSFELLADGNVEMLFHGDPRSNYEIETSTNLVDWLPLGTASPTLGQFRFVDSNAANSDIRFYRVIQAR